jgi:hypothetical protein
LDIHHFPDSVPQALFSGKKIYLDTILPETSACAGYRHFHLKKGKFKQGFIYENAQKKVLENCNFCPGKSLKSP